MEDESQGLYQLTKEFEDSKRELTRQQTQVDRSSTIIEKIIAERSGMPPVIEEAEAYSRKLQRIHEYLLHGGRLFSYHLDTLLKEIYLEFGKKEFTGFLHTVGLSPEGLAKRYDHATERKLDAFHSGSGYVWNDNIYVIPNLLARLGWSALAGVGIGGLLFSVGTFGRNMMEYKGDSSDLFYASLFLGGIVGAIGAIASFRSERNPHLALADKIKLEAKDLQTFIDGYQDRKTGGKG
mgnify:CR=1 FL=1